ncbi:MAG: 4-hydroxy-3-methylbut-2-enyl diphosphate reductase [Pseudolabrys sp.]|nr:4-hydroxy-3-methylbut-2-enyl diphosphate reductase [Pseudolabrys sp.]
MKIILAKPRGFCAGVVRAIEIVERALDKYGPPVYVRHEIVHNKWVVDALRARGARFVEDLSEVPAGAITIFSAHGVAKAVENDAAARDLHVLNATCPLVSKVHAQGRHYLRNGRTVVLIGHAGHPEVVGTLGQIPGPVLLVQSEEDVEALELAADTPIAYVTQTTLSVDDTRGIIEALYRRFNDVVGPGTKDICYATQNRQTALLQLSRLVDVIFVVGAKNSSNSNRLREIGEEAGVPTHLIASGAEIRPEWLEGVDIVGLTAGASAPETMVKDVVATLRRFASPVEVFTLPGEDENIEFRVPVDLLDVAGASKISKDGNLGHSSTAEAACR